MFDQSTYVYRQTELLYELLHPLLLLRARDGTEAEVGGEHKRLVDGEHGEQAVVLHDVGRDALDEAGAHLLAVEGHPPLKAAARDPAGQAVEEGGLAGAARAHDGRDAALGGVPGDPAEQVHLLRLPPPAHLLLLGHGVRQLGELEAPGEDRRRGDVDRGLVVVNGHPLFVPHCGRGLGSSLPAHADGTYRPEEGDTGIQHSPNDAVVTHRRGRSRIRLFRYYTRSLYRRNPFDSIVFVVVVVFFLTLLFSVMACYRRLLSVLWQRQAKSQEGVASVGGYKAEQGNSHCISHIELSIRCSRPKEDCLDFGWHVSTRRKQQGRGDFYYGRSYIRQLRVLRCDAKLKEEQNLRSWW